MPTSIMDGYAVVSSDGPGEYTLCAHSRAGDTSELEVLPGTVAYITTGAPLPKGKIKAGTRMFVESLFTIAG